MSFGRFSAYKVTTWMDTVVSDPKWMTLVSADPLGVSDPLTVELTTTRIQGAWSRTSNNSLTLTSALTWTGLLSGAHIAGVAGFDGQVNGNLLFSDLLQAPIDLPEGGSFTLPAGQYVLGIDVPGA